MCAPRRAGAWKETRAGSPPAAGSSSGLGTLSCFGPIDVTRTSGGSVSLTMLRGSTTARPWRRRLRRMRYVPSGAMRRFASRPSHATRARSPMPSSLLGSSSRTSSPAASTTVAVTSSSRWSKTNDARARSKRPSPLGEKNGVTLKPMRGGLLLSSCAAKNAANVAQTSSANAVRASALTRPPPPASAGSHGVRPG